MARLFHNFAPYALCLTPFAFGFWPLTFESRHVKFSKMKKTTITFLLTFSLFFTTTLVPANLPETSLDLIPTLSRNYKTKLNKLARKQGSAGDYFKLKLAEQKLKALNPTEAFKFVSRVQDPLFGFWKNTVLAEVYFAMNKNREALALLKKLPTKPKYELFFGEGIYENIYKRALITRYLAKKALNHSTAKTEALLLSLFPGDKTLDEVLGKGALSAALTKTQKVEQLHNLYLKRRLKNIPSLISATDIKKTNLPKNDKCRALYELGSAMRTVKKHRDESIAVYREVLNLGCKDKHRPRALYRLGATKPSQQSQQPDIREQSLLQLYREFPNHRLADDALYKLYKLAIGENNKRKANKHYNKLMGLKKGDMKSELAFELAFPYYKKQKYSKAASLLAKALKITPTADESHTRCLYWYAKSLEKMKGRKRTAQKNYQKLVDEFPYSFYAVLAARQLGIKTPRQKLPPLEGVPPEEGFDFFILIDEFNRDGFHKAARSVLEFALYKHPEWETANQAHKEYLVTKLIESQNYRKALDIASKHFESGFYGPIQGAEDPLFAAFYPQAFERIIKNRYKETDLPQGAIEGIMREESLFQTTAKSVVGATGLMQLMPSTAAFVKKGLESVYISSDLTDPKSNIILGSTYLEQMKNKFNDELPLAIMAYNAGPGNVRKWLKRNSNMELDEFIENIPFRETRGYVKRVMRTMSVYGGFYNESYFTKAQHFSFEIMPKKRNEQ